MSQPQERTYVVITKSGRFEVKGHGFSWRASDDFLFILNAENSQIAVFSGSELVGIVHADALMPIIPEEDLDLEIEKEIQKQVDHRLAESTVRAK